MSSWNFGVQALVNSQWSVSGPRSRGPSQSLSWLARRRVCHGFLRITERDPRYPLRDEENAEIWERQRAAFWRPSSVSKSHDVMAFQRGQIQTCSRKDMKSHLFDSVTRFRGISSLLLVSKESALFAPALLLPLVASTRHALPHPILTKMKDEESLSRGGSGSISTVIITEESLDESIYPYDADIEATASITPMLDELELASSSIYGSPSRWKQLEALSAARTLIQTHAVVCQADGSDFKL
eukprot:760290-Hanusia_phi.AAC.5